MDIDLRNILPGPPHGLPAVPQLDIKMPRMGGPEVLAAVRGDQDLGNLPVVMLTSSRESPDVQAACDLGADACVVNPVGFAESEDAVRQIGAFRALFNEPAPSGADT